MIAGPAFPRFGRLLAEAGSLEEITAATLNLQQQDRFQKVFSTIGAGGRSASKLVADEFAALADESDS
ncbi:MAG: hypothetical protein GY910_00225 [bacterium]|nr:hypothetical protein [Deltaproteobacteria bacterium]MCP4903382.1 hypothetical protein [bacterium]